MIHLDSRLKGKTKLNLSEWGEKYLSTNQKSLVIRNTQLRKVFAIINYSERITHDTSSERTSL